jgi:hypothetical protein
MIPWVLGFEILLLFLVVEMAREIGMPAKVV